MVEKRRFERIHIAIETMTYTKYKDFFENKEIFVYGFKHMKTDKVDIYILLGCASDELHERDKVFYFWSSKCKNKGIELRIFKKNRMAFYAIS